MYEYYKTVFYSCFPYLRRGKESEGSLKDEDEVKVEPRKGSQVGYLPILLSSPTRPGKNNGNDNCNGDPASGPFSTPKNKRIPEPKTPGAPRAKRRSRSTSTSPCSACKRLVYR